MSAFKALRYVCNEFERELHKVSEELTSVNVAESFEDGVSKKSCDLTMLTAKFRLLKAKTFAVTPQVRRLEKGEHTVKNYEESVIGKVLEQCTVKSLTQMQAVQALITAPDSSLPPELIDRKRKIIESLDNFKQKETQLRYLDSVLKEKEQDYESVRTEWESELKEMTEKQETIQGDVELSGPLYMKLTKVVSKLEMMRWLVGRLVLARTPRYDWLADPRRRLAALALTRQHNTVQYFTDM